MYARYFALLLVYALMWVVNRVFAPLIVLFADKDGWLPRWLWWFQTPGDSLDGSEDWQKDDRWFLVQDTPVKVILNRVGWIYRNQVYGFRYAVLGFQGQPTDVLLTTGDPLVSNHKVDFHAGVMRHTLMRDGKPIAFQIYIIAPLPFGRYFRGNFGWKLWSFPTTEKLQFVFSPNPFRKM